MDIMITLWQFGILAIILVFGFEIGLTSKLFNLPKKLFYIICASYFGGYLIISFIASFYVNQINSTINSYNSLFYIIMAIIMIVAGLFTIREWKTYKKNTKRMISLSIIAPCLCCFGLTIASTLIVGPAIKLNTFYLNILVVIALIIVMIITYFASNMIIKFIKTPYPIVLSNLMLFLSAYFLLSAFVVPNIMDALEKSSKGIIINSPETIVYAVIFIVILISIGFILNKKYENLLN